jgi:hypothetical protein
LVWPASCAAGGDGVHSEVPQVGFGALQVQQVKVFKRNLPICPLYSVGYKFSEEYLQESTRIFFFSQSQMLHSQIVTKSDSSLPVCGDEDFHFCTLRKSLSPYLHLAKTRLP